MQAAIDILKKKLEESYVMQHSEYATAYVNSLMLAIKVLERYNDKLQKAVQDQSDSN